MKRHRQCGFSLLEVLVTVVILSIGMLGVAAVLVTVHKANASSYLRQQAVQETYDILDRMRANRSAALQGGYDVALNTAPGTPSTNCTSGSCSPAQLASYDKWQWRTDITNNLPSGTGSVVTAPFGASPNVSTQVTVVVQWSDTPAQQTFKQTVAPATYTLQTVL